MHRRSGLDRIVEGLAVLAGLGLCILTLLICADVAVRRLGTFSMPWTLDVAEYLLYMVTFLGAPWVLRDGGHIAVDLVTQHLRERSRRRVVLVTNSIGALVCIVLTFYACKVWWVSYSEGIQVYETFVFSEWYLLSVTPPVFALLAAIFVQAIVRGAKSSRGMLEDGF